MYLLIHDGIKVNPCLWKAPRSCQDNNFAVTGGTRFAVMTNLSATSYTIWSPFQYKEALIRYTLQWHHNEVASQITSLTIVYSTVSSGADERKYQSFATLAFLRKIRRVPVVSPHKGPVTWKMFPFDDDIMTFEWFLLYKKNHMTWEVYHHNSYEGNTALYTENTENDLCFWRYLPHCNLKDMCDMRHIFSPFLRARSCISDRKHVNGFSSIFITRGTTGNIWEGHKLCYAWCDCFKLFKLGVVEVCALELRFVFSLGTVVWRYHYKRPTSIWIVALLHMMVHSNYLYIRTTISFYYNYFKYFIYAYIHVCIR